MGSAPIRQAEEGGDRGCKAECCDGEERRLPIAEMGEFETHRHAEHRSEGEGHHRPAHGAAAPLGRDQIADHGQRDRGHRPAEQAAQGARGDQRGHVDGERAEGASDGEAQHRRDQRGAPAESVEHERADQARGGGGQRVSAGDPAELGDRDGELMRKIRPQRHDDHEGHDRHELDGGDKRDRARLGIAAHDAVRYSAACAAGVAAGTAAGWPCLCVRASSV